MRLLKQFLYGTFYLLLIGAVVWGIYLLVPKTPPSCFDNQQNQDEAEVDCGGAFCMSCAEKNLQDLLVAKPELFSADRLFSVIAEVQNPNTAFAAKDFDYEFNFYDTADKILKTVKNTSFIYGGESKDIIEAGVRITAGIPKRAEIKINHDSVTWVKAENFSAPVYDLKEVVALIEGDQAVISGNVTNPNNFILSKIIINSFLINQLGDKLGASRTEFQEVGPFRVQSFKIFIPIGQNSPDSIDLEETARRIFVEVLK